MKVKREYFGSILTASFSSHFFNSNISEFITDIIFHQTSAGPLGNCPTVYASFKG